MTVIEGEGGALGGSGVRWRQRIQDKAALIADWRLALAHICDLPRVEPFQRTAILAVGLGQVGQFRPRGALALALVVVMARALPAPLVIRQLGQPALPASRVPFCWAAAAAAARAAACALASLAALAASAVALAAALAAFLLCTSAPAPAPAAPPDEVADARAAATVWLIRATKSE